LSHREQFERLVRNYQRLAQIERGRKHDMPSEHYRDDVYSFFLNCYHLKDWLINDLDFPATSAEIESYINAHQELQLCADIRNAHKHLQLKKPRSAENPSVGGQQIHLTLGPEEPAIKIKFTIDTASGPRDAFDLATKCLELWRQFIISKGGAP
jgi:hypothetical protein